MAHVNNRRQASITITFKDPAGALGWFEKAQSDGWLQTESALFQKDGLDDIVGSSGVPSSNEFIVRRDRDRPYGKVQFGSRISDVVTVSKP